jgi:hypothetical protein
MNTYMRYRPNRKAGFTVLIPPPSAQKPIYNILTGELPSFCKEHGLSYSKIQKMLRGEIMHYNGWIGTPDRELTKEYPQIDKVPQCEGQQQLLDTICFHSSINLTTTSKGVKVSHKTREQQHSNFKATQEMDAEDRFEMRIEKLKEVANCNDDSYELHEQYAAQDLLDILEDNMEDDDNEYGHDEDGYDYYEKLHKPGTPTTHMTYDEIMSISDSP